MAKTFSLLSLSFLSFTFLSMAARAEEWKFSGSVKTFLYVLDAAPLPGAEGGWILDTPLRLRLLKPPDGGPSLEAAVELTHQSQGGGGAASPFLAPVSPYRILDVDTPVAGPVAGEGSRLFVNLDRLSAQFRLGEADLILGRQVVSFGPGRTANPTDVLAPFNVQVRDQENRSGVDAARLRLPLGAFGGVDAGYVAGPDARFGNSAAFIRPHFKAGGADVSLMGMVFRENLLLGADVQGSLGGAGVWAEGAWVEPRTDIEEGYGRIVCGADYFFPGEVYGSLEYHFNSPGREDSADYLFPSSPTAYGEGTVYLLGRHYLAPSVSFPVDPLLATSGQVLVNLTDGSLLAIAGFDYNVAEDWYVGLGASLPIGPGSEGFVPKSEFGLYPAFTYVSGRFYF